MSKEKTVEMQVKSVFAGNRSVEQVFFEIIRRKSLEKIPNPRYNIDVVFPGVHAAKGELIC